MIAEAVKVSLRDRMLHASSLDELDNLRAESRRYNNARPNTRTKWKKAYQRRESELLALISEAEREARQRAKEERHEANKRMQQK